MVADKGYSARSFRAYLRRRGIKERPSPSPSTNSRAGHDAANGPAASTGPSRRRNVVERCFHRLKQWRGIATRYDKQPGRYCAAITLVSALIWLDT